MLRSAMPLPGCPSCGQATTRHLSAPSKDAPVDFFACQCGHVWRVSNDDPTLITHITPLKKSDKTDRVT
jgi:hypothetical protein